MIMQLDLTRLADRERGRRLVRYVNQVPNSN